VPDPCFVGLGVDPDRQGRQRLEQGAEEGAIAWHGQARFATVEQCLDADPEQPGRKRRIGEVALRRPAESGDVVAGR